MYFFDTIYIGMNRLNIPFYNYLEFTYIYIVGVPAHSRLSEKLAEIIPIEPAQVMLRREQCTSM